MDSVAALLDEISRLPEMASLGAKAGSFLNDVAEIYERHGGGTTRAYLLNQLARRNRPEASLVLRVVEKLDASPAVRMNRAIGRQIIKCLFELRKGAKR